MSAVSIMDAALTGSLPRVKVTLARAPARAVMPCRVGVDTVGSTQAEPLSAARMLASAPMTAMDLPARPRSGSAWPEFLSSVIALAWTARATAWWAATGMAVGV